MGTNYFPTGKFIVWTLHYTTTISINQNSRISSLSSTGYIPKTSIDLPLYGLTSFLTYANILYIFLIKKSCVLLRIAVLIGRVNSKASRKKQTHIWIWMLDATMTHSHTAKIGRLLRLVDTIV